MADCEFPGRVQDFLLNFWPDPQLQTLEDIVEWNKKHDEAERFKRKSFAMTDLTRQSSEQTFI